jgi:hypothetical protein
MKKKKEAERTLRTFFIELLVYSVLVAAYFFLVLHFLTDWLKQLNAHHIKIYALVSIALIIGQAVVLETVTTGLFRLIRGRPQ